MKVIKVVLKIFIVSILLIAILITSISLYIKFYGKNLIMDALSNMLGVRVKFENISLNLDEYAINFKGFSIPSEISFEKETVFDAEKFSLVLNRDKLKEEGRVVFEKLIIKKGVLNIVRNHKGVFNISYHPPEKDDYRSGIAYADQPAATIDLYNLAKNVKGIYIQDSIINFKDHYLPRGPIAVRCDNFGVTLVSELKEKSLSNFIPMKFSVGFKIPGKRLTGDFRLDGDIYVLKDRVDMDIEIDTRSIDVMQFLPYFNNYTPFSFNEGIFSSETKFVVKDNIIDSLTTMVFHRLKLLVDPGKENTRFLEASVNRLAPYLMSRKGEIIFDFVIKGPLENPRIGLGPRVKFAVGLVVAEELSNMLQQLQKLRGIK